MSPGKNKKTPTESSEGIEKALKRAGERARKAAEDSGTDLVYWKDGKVELVKPSSKKAA